jgi:transposase
MGWAYSLDLRERVVGAFDAGGMTDEQVAEVFRVGEATVHRWKRLKRETGSLVPPPPRGGGMPPRIAPERYDLVWCQNGIGYKSQSSSALASLHAAVGGAI